MHNYLITILMRDGSRGTYRSSFRNDWDAIDTVLGAFHDAQSIRARRLS